jgi:hypothetical protein
MMVRVCSSYKQEHKVAKLESMLEGAFRQEQSLVHAFILQCLLRPKRKGKDVPFHDMKP